MNRFLFYPWELRFWNSIQWGLCEYFRKVILLDCNLTFSHANVIQFPAFFPVSPHHYSFLSFPSFSEFSHLHICLASCHPLPPPPSSSSSPSSRSPVPDECDVGWHRLVVHRRRLPGEPKAGGHCSQQGQRVGEGRMCVCRSLHISWKACLSGPGLTAEDPQLVSVKMSVRQTISGDLKVYSTHAWVFIYHLRQK